jgi:hypothetical protein
VQRCPWAAKLFLTVGDWGFKIFGDDVVREPVLAAWPAPAAYFTCGRWHPKRPSVVLTGTSDGHVYVWDVSLPLVEPCMALKVADRPIDSLQARGNRAVATDRSGIVYVIALPDVIAEPSPSERVSVVAMLEREYAKARAAQSATPAASAVDGDTNLTPALLTQSLSRSYKQSRSDGATPLYAIGSRGSTVEAAEEWSAELTDAYLSHVLAEERSEDVLGTLGSLDGDDLSGTQKASSASYSRRRTQLDGQPPSSDEDVLGGEGDGQEAAAAPEEVAAPLRSPFTAGLRQGKPKVGMGTF